MADFFLAHVHPPKKKSTRNIFLQTKSNFPLLWKLLRMFFFPQNDRCFHQDFAWSVLCLVVFKRPQAGARWFAGECCHCVIWRCLRVLPLRDHCSFFP
jgi:hypothetical protein